jgi:uncharacterized protein (TIGR04255 family)
MTRQPIRIDAPIEEATFELRFRPAIYPGAVFGLIYRALQDTHAGEVTRLPIMQLPDEIREKDELLIYRPHYRIRNERFTVQVGPRVLLISCADPYPGWDHFSEEIYADLAAVLQQEVIDEVERLGLRYVNRFTKNVSDQLTITVVTDSEAIQTGNYSLGLSVEKDEFTNYVFIDNEAPAEGTPRMTLIDIDTYLTRRFDVRNWDYRDTIERMHTTEKQVFFGLLKDEFVQTLNPQYE